MTADRPGTAQVAHEAAGSVRVAIVDDQLHYYPALLAQGLAARGHRVVHQVERVEDLPPEVEVDVVICDLRLVRRNGASGADAVALLVGQSRRVLLTSATAGEEEVLAGIAAGAAGYISKVCPPDEHVDALVAVARHGNYVGRELAVVLVTAARKWPALPRGELTRTELAVLRGLARGDRPDDISGELRLPPGRLPEVTARCLDVTRRRRVANQLSDRAREVLVLAGCRHLSRKDIAAELYITDDTLGDHLRRIREYYVRLREEDRHIKPLAAAEALARLCGLCDDDGPAGVR